MAQKKFRDLNLANAFLFAAAMSDPEVCRSIRLDVYSVDGEGNHYNVEMQGENKGNLPKRIRFHQAEMDVLGLRPGEDFIELEPNYVIFICCFDPFGKGLYRYTFTNKCTENGMELGDETMKVFVSTKGSNAQDVSAELVHFLQYVENSTDACVEELGDNVIRHLHERIQRIKESREWERKYMRFEELLQDKFKEGREEGSNEMKGRMSALITKMVAAGEVDKLPLLGDASFLEEMYQKYEL